jgi:hypothetical protein
MTAARSHRQLQNRLRNIKKFSDVKVFECPKCGGTEWTTTEAMVEPEPRPKWWQRSYLLFKKEGKERRWLNLIDTP